MKRLFVVLLVLGITGCSGQQKEKEQEDVQKKEFAEAPKGEWQVFKEYDELGNLKKYDSIYSFKYSNIEGDSLIVNLDSLMNSFRGFFNERAPFPWKDRFSYFPGPDSLFMKDFFEDDYFSQQWARQQFDLEEMMKQMDSTRRAFFEKYHPGLIDKIEDQ
jgi:hypothetical protein